MANKWVDRNASNNIARVYHNEQREGQEVLPEDHPDLLAFFAPKPKTPLDKLREEYPPTLEILEAILEDRDGKPGKLNGLVADYKTLKVKHGV